MGFLSSWKITAVDCYGRVPSRRGFIPRARSQGNRAQSGESRTAGKTSTQDKSPQKRGGPRSGNRQAPGGPTRDQLYNEAKKGRSGMSKKERQNTLGR
jgi:hypothetical protein